MNLTALHQVSSAWPEVLSTLCRLAGRDASVCRVWQVALVGIAVPLLSEEPISRAKSALYKTCLGLSQVTATLLLRDEEIAAMPFASLGTSSDFFSALDDHRWLLGQIQVCAGTQPMFEQFFSVLSGTQREDTPAIPIDGPDRIAHIAASTIAAHTAMLLWADHLRGRGHTIEMPAIPPWLRAVHAEPFRSPSHARRYFPKGQTPAELEPLIDIAPGSYDSLLDAFARTLADIRLG